MPGSPTNKASPAKKAAGRVGVSSAHYADLTEKNVHLEHISTLEEVARNERQVAEST